jgi:hypothetical protein
MLSFGFISVLSVLVAGAVARVELAPRAVASAGGGNCYCAYVRALIPTKLTSPVECEPETAGIEFTSLSSNVDPTTGDSISTCM